MKYDAEKYQLSHRGNFGTIALVIGVIGVLGSIGGWFTDPDRLFYSYLTAFTFWVSLALAGLFFTMLHYLTSARWSVVLRRISESMMIQLPWMILLFVPIIFGMHELYHWSHVEAVAADHLLQAKSVYLNVGFFTGRTVLYFGIWSACAILLWRRSLAQDRDPNSDHMPGLRRVAVIGMLLFAFTVTFASFDWLMSLQPHWYSTIFGVYFFGGCFLAGLSLMVVTSWLLRRQGVLRTSITPEHYHDLGKLMFAFVIFWAYIGFSQYFLIWYGNIPEETFWFLSRWEGIWLLVMHWVDLYWLVYPSFQPQSAGVGWIEIAPMLGLGGLFMWRFWSSFSSAPLVPTGDPWVSDSLNHHT